MSMRDACSFCTHLSSREAPEAEKTSLWREVDRMIEHQS